MAVFGINTNGVVESASLYPPEVLSSGIYNAFFGYMTNMQAFTVDFVVDAGATSNCWVNVGGVWKPATMTGI